MCVACEYHRAPYLAIWADEGGCGAVHGDFSERSPGDLVAVVPVSHAPSDPRRAVVDVARPSAAVITLWDETRLAMYTRRRPCCLMDEPTPVFRDAARAMLIAFSERSGNLASTTDDDPMHLSFRDATSLLHWTYGIALFKQRISSSSDKSPKIGGKTSPIELDR